MQSRKWMKKSDLFIIGGFLVLALVGFGYIYLRQNQSSAMGENYAVLSVDGKPVAAYYLGKYHEGQTIALKEYIGVQATLEFADGRVRFVQVDCPDKVCESVGYIHQELESAICLPNKLALMIYTPEEYESMTEPIAKP